MESFGGHDESLGENVAREADFTAQYSACEATASAVTNDDRPDFNACQGDVESRISSVTGTIRPVIAD
jgi:hypothetical protein